MADDDRPDQNRPPKTLKSTAKPWAAGPLPTISAAYEQAARLTGTVPVVTSSGTAPPAKATGPGRRPRRGRSSTHPRQPDDIIGPNDEIIFEFGPRGDFVQVYAMHVPTLTEVAVMGPSKATSRELEQLALSKLRFVLRKQRGEG